VEILEDADCVVASDWQSYQIQQGDNLLSIVNAVSSTLPEVRDGNCYEAIQGVFIGESILVPQLPAEPVATAQPIFITEGGIYEIMGCQSETLRINSPLLLNELQGIFPILGSADTSDFSYYKIEIRPEWSERYYLYLESATVVTNDLLGLVNAEIFGDGVHYLRLTVVTTNDEIPENGVCEIPVVFVSP